MIESIQLAGVATYGNTPVPLDGLSKFNFFYGSNGSGKTTISRVIADQEKLHPCTVAWRGGTQLQPLVYNCDFVTKNFSQGTELKGIFTLGEKNIQTIEEIGRKKNDVDVRQRDIHTWRVALSGTDGSGGKLKELASLENELKSKCWAQKQKHDAQFSMAFKGFRDS